MAGIEKTLFILSIDLAKIDGTHFIPTALYYNDNTIIFGHKAINKLEDYRIVNANFKIELGNYDASKKLSEHRIFEADDGSEKTAFEITKDFFDLILSEFEGQSSLQKYEKKGLKIMVAEPLAFQLEDKRESWIKHYRDNIRRILYHYENIEFLPEPFAVYQYYRYGLRVPQLEDKAKHIVLIVDFGGGTFDVSIIESTNEGDISKTKKHSKPLAASSEPVGGFVINEKIAEYILKRGLENSSEIRKIEQFVRAYHRSINKELDFDKLNIEKKNFIRNFSILIQKIENKKIELCKKIANWDLYGDSYEKVLIDIPGDVFLEKPNWNTVSFYAHELRKIFRDEIWNKRIKTVLKSAIERAREPLKGRQITATLISGGSSNIRWFERLITEEFGGDLAHAKPIPLSGSFQEIVAKGLAIECARRFYNPDSEFVSVTYNPLRLLLNPDGQGIEHKKYAAIDNKIDMGEAEPCVLLPSAAALKNFINEPLQWKIKLSKAPRRSLEYHFLRPSDKPLHEQPNDVKNLYNINNMLHTSAGAKFEGKIRVELTVKEDGTTYPKFIYTVGNESAGIEECSEMGQPFVIDMTTEHKITSAERYIGFDFGTSNTSLSILTNEQIEIIEMKSKDSSWLEINDLVHKLPYPISYPLRKYLSATNSDKSVENARDAFEAMLSFIAYTAASELLAMGGFKPTIMKSFQHRSMGPLKSLIQNSLTRSGKRAVFVSSVKNMFDKHAQGIEDAIGEFNEHKHKKRSAERVNARVHLLMLGNICNEMLKDKIFGYFEEINPEKFKKGHYNGLFKGAYDSQPFCDKFIYKGKHMFAISEPILFDVNTKKAISLLPFIFWEEDLASGGNLKCYALDKIDKDIISYKTIGDESVKEINEGYDELKEQVLCLYQDPNLKSEYFEFELCCQDER